MKFVAHVPEARSNQVLVVLLPGSYESEGNTITTYGEAGKLYAHGLNQSPRDLFMAEEEITVYFNEYKNGVFGVPVRDEGHLPTLPHVVKTHAVRIKV